MAKYAQGFERKSSDTKNLILLVVIIVAAVALVLGAVAIINKTTDFSVKTYSDSKYQQYFIGSDNYNKLLKQQERDYVIYVCDKSVTYTDKNAVDPNMNAILTYIDKYEEGKVNIKLYLIDYSVFSSDDTAVREGLELTSDISIGAKYLIAVTDSRTELSQIYTDSSTSSTSIKDIINKLSKNEPWLTYNNE